MEYHAPYKSKLNKLGIATANEKGRIVFKRIYYQIIFALEFIDNFLDEFDNEEANIYNRNELLNLRSNENIIERKINLAELAKIDIAYSLVFYGISSESEAALRRQLLKFYNEDFVNPIISFVCFSLLIFIPIITSLKLFLL
ncbi:hypothetical protein [Pedobacter xixiisoli]|uniref:Uncharacterized protein n=2 Tax=Pedobacter xixiisoli TaxID=1476464 RepID=A0A285ZZS3_9SPHI|nr:hypothetical protein [Pedobacter xixiisoli]SOD15138.1 hypothetical protein SAMN06297358_2113 [Pedobacter xixiisoli]